MRRFFARLFAPFRKSAAEEDLNTEIQHHLDLLEDRFRRQGLDPAKARAAARRAFGNREQLKEDHRQTRSFIWMEHLAQDFRYAVRMAFRNKAWAVLTIVTLSFGIGPLTALYSLYDRSFLTPPPAVAHPEELAAFFQYAHNPRVPRPEDARALQLKLSLADFQAMKAVNATLSEILAFDDEPYNPVSTITRGTLGKAHIQFVSGTYFSMLQVKAIRGRMLAPDEDSPAAPPVAVISEVYWDRAFSRDPDVLGQTITIGKEPYTIVGVWPESFVNAMWTPSGSLLFPGPNRPEIMIPLAHDVPSLRDSHRTASPLVAVMGRRKPDVSLAEVQANFEGIVNKDEAEFRSRLLIRPATPGLWALQNDFAALPSWAPLLIGLILSFFAIPLILSCSNVATFLLARAEDRRVEIGMRLAIGAGRGRLMCQLLTESILLSVMSGFAGLLVACWWIRLFANPPFSSYGDLALNWRAIGFTCLISLPAGIACGLLPARAAAADAAALLRAFSQGVSRAPSSRTRNLIGVQVAMSLFGLIAVGLMVRTIRNVHILDAGFNTEKIAIFTIDPNAGMQTYDSSRMAVLLGRILGAAGAIPGVEAATYSDQPILTGKTPSAGIYLRTAEHKLQSSDVNWIAVDDNFFTTLEIPLKLGRSFAANDPALPQKVVVNQAFVRALLPGVNPIGSRFGKDLKNLDGYEVVGVAADVKTTGAAAMSPTVYVPPECCVVAPKTFEVRAVGNPAALLPAIRNALNAVDANLPVTRLTTPQAEMEATYLSGAATFKFILDYYAGLSMVLAVTGLFGLMSHIVAGRTREIGIRMALGAHPREVRLAVMRQTVRTALPGILVGLLAAFAAGRFVRDLLYDVRPYDPVTIVSAVLAMILIAILAGYLPAQKASRVDPMVALRHE